MKQVEPQYIPSLVKMEKQFMPCVLKKDQEPDIWITQFEDFRMMLVEIGSSILDNPFMLHELKNMTSEHNLQLAMMENP